MLVMPAICIYKAHAVGQRQWVRQWALLVQKFISKRLVELYFTFQLSAFNDVN
jgi:hypothetical protein